MLPNKNSSDKTKILYISYDGATDPLGQSQILPYLKKLTRDDIEFILVTYDKIEYRSKNIFKALRDELSNSGIRWVSLNYHKEPKVLAKLYDISLGIIACAILLKKNKITIIHGRSFVGAFIAMVLKRLFKVKFLLDYRGLWADERVDGGLWLKDSLLFKLSKYIEKMLLLNADEVTVLTKRARETIDNFSYISNRLKIQVIPTCVDLERFKPNVIGKVIQPNNKLTMIYVGSLGTWYMLNEMIDFFIELRKVFVNSHFSFLTPTKPELIEGAMKIKSVSPLCYSIKSVSYNEISYWLSEADLSIFFINPFFSKISSCPTKLGESLACGLPVIINSGIGDCDEIVKENKVGVIVERFSQEAYKKAIFELRGLLQNRIDLGLRCRRAAETRLSLEKGVELYRQIYKRLEE
ncbi:MAG: glycosyltransferase [Candidatus Omnitrophota bacterium]|nr:glycosyltransferase [Candidatus Omnitrophota bacterium]